MPPGPTAAGRRDLLAGQVIALLEDDELVRRATRRMLTRFGAEVVDGRSSAEVLAQLASRDLVASSVVADFWLSREENGLAAAAALRAEDGGRLRGIILTGDVSRPTAEAVAAAGFRLLRKPVDVACFLDALLGHG